MTQKEKAHEIVKAMLKNGSSFIENSNSLEEDSQFGYVFVKEAVELYVKI
jgi:hypothetical protein